VISIRKEGIMSRFASLAKLASLIVFLGGVLASVTSAQEDPCVQGWPPGNAWVVGKEPWWSQGDIVQFVGDANITLLGDTECSSFDEYWVDCQIDTAFNFRRAIDFQEDGCLYEEGDTCYVSKVKCCFWWNYQPVCGLCTCSCNPRYLCKTVWEVVAFYEDGDTGRGCYELEFVSNCPNEDCDAGLSMCNTVLKWNE
jgi:hypothetical protein